MTLTLVLWLPGPWYVSKHDTSKSGRVRVWLDEPLGASAITRRRTSPRELLPLQPGSQNDIKHV